jgi:Actin
LRNLEFDSSQHRSFGEKHDDLTSYSKLHLTVPGTFFEHNFSPLWVQLPAAAPSPSTVRPPIARAHTTMASFYNGDYVGAVVADVGHYSTKIGWAGDDYPVSYFRSVRRTKSSAVEGGPLL